MTVDFGFETRTRVCIKEAKISGEIRGLAVDLDGVKHALVRFVTGDGDIKERWEREEDIEVT